MEVVGMAWISLVFAVPIIMECCTGKGGLPCLKNIIVRSGPYWMAPFKEVRDWRFRCRGNLWDEPIQQCNEGF